MGNCIVQRNWDQQRRNYAKSRFQFIEIIGRGAFGEVWKVIDKCSRELCALKIMDKVRIISSNSIRTVIQEKNILQALGAERSDLVSNIKASFQDREKLYILMEFITGRNLRAYLTKERQLNEQQIKFVVVTLLKILRYIHSKNIIHGDIKPENIMINHQGLPHITDFGIASFFKRSNAHENGGTLPYMAPEVVSGLSHNFTIDYYAIGIITFQLFCHCRPHTADNYQELRDEIISKEINSSTCPQLHSIPEAAADFITQLVQRSPDKRLGDKTIEQIFEHPWIKSESNDSLIIRNDCQVFKSKEPNQERAKEADEIKSEGEDNELIRNMLDRKHIQKMFEPFNFSIRHQRQDPASTTTLLQPKRSYSLTAEDFQALRTFRKQSIAG